MQWVVCSWALGNSALQLWRSQVTWPVSLLPAKEWYGGLLMALPLGAPIVALLRTSTGHSPMYYFFFLFWCACVNIQNHRLNYKEKRFILAQRPYPMSSGCIWGHPSHWQTPEAKKGIAQRETGEHLCVLVSLFLLLSPQIFNYGHSTLRISSNFNLFSKASPVNTKVGIIFLPFNIS